MHIYFCIPKETIKSKKVKWKVSVTHIKHIPSTTVLKMKCPDTSFASTTIQLAAPLSMALLSQFPFSLYKCLI